MILYKYTTYDIGLKILEEGKFRYTQPYCFNDPFELYPILEDIFTVEQYEEIYNSVMQPNIMDYIFQTTIKKEYDKLSDFQKSIIPYEQYFVIMKNAIHKEIETNNMDLKQIVYNNLNNGDANTKLMIDMEYLKIINSTIGIFCLSKKNDDILMWSHYCNSHTGVVLIINIDNSFFEKLDKVNYPIPNDRPKLKLSKRSYTPEESIEAYKNIFVSKSSDWAYEEEYRDFKLLINGEITDHYDQSGFPTVLFEYPKDIIEGVIFGTRLTDDKIIDFMDKVEAKYSNISFEKAFLNMQKYSLDILKISRAV